MNVFRPNLRVTQTEGTYHVSGPCAVTGEEYATSYPERGVKLWIGGMHIQDAMPEISADDREFLLTGISPAGWDKLFAQTGRSL